MRFTTLVSTVVAISAAANAFSFADLTKRVVVTPSGPGSGGGGGGGGGSSGSGGGGGGPPGGIFHRCFSISLRDCAVHRTRLIFLL